jgi:hypothetical protein
VTVLEACTTEEQRSVVHFLWTEGRSAKIFINKRVLFTVGSVCRVKRLTTESRNYLKDVRKSQMIPEQVALLRLRQKQLCSGWKS